MMEWTESGIREYCLARLPLIMEAAKNRNIWIYGAGTNGKILASLLGEKGYAVSGFIDQKADSLQTVDELPVKHLQDINPQEDYALVSMAAIDYEVIFMFQEQKFTVKDFYYVFWDGQYHECDYVFRGCDIGKYTYGAESMLQYTSLVKSIGRFCSINATARVWENHPMDYVTTHPFLDMPVFWPWDKFDSEERNLYINKYGKYTINGKNSIRKNYEVVIGNDVWVGANALIMPGVHIGNGAVIGGGAVVTHDVAPYAIVGGVPAGVIRFRFPKEMIDKFERIRWWNWDNQKIKENLELFYQPEKFLSLFG